MPLAKDPTKLDPVNQRILRHLAHSARMSYTALAEKLRLSPNTVRDRILSMERKGIIQGYGAVVDDAKLGLPLRALALVDSRGATLDADRLREIPEVRSAYRSPSRYGLILELVGRDLQHVQDTMRHVVDLTGDADVRLIPLGDEPILQRPAAAAVPLERDGTFLEATA